MIKWKSRTFSEKLIYMFSWQPFLLSVSSTLLLSHTLSQKPLLSERNCLLKRKPKQKQTNKAPISQKWGANRWTKRCDFYHIYTHVTTAISTCSELNFEWRFCTLSDRGRRCLHLATKERKWHHIILCSTISQRKKKKMRRSKEGSTAHTFVKLGWIDMLRLIDWTWKKNAMHF